MENNIRAAVVGVGKLIGASLSYATDFMENNANRSAITSSGCRIYMQTQFIQRLLAILIVSLSGLNCFAQNPSDTLMQKLSDYVLQHPQEKIYVRTDKPHYVPGDTLWMKAYITDAVLHLADTVSKNIYVDFVHKASGQILHHLMLKNEGGFARGQLTLADTIQSGVYNIISYTQWMRNFSSALFYEQEVFVREKVRDIKAYNDEDAAKASAVADLKFFIEGGQMVVGKESRVAFKAVNEYGKGVDFKAYIVSDHNDTLSTIRSHHLGMGFFILMPRAGERYYAKIAESTAPSSYPLPEARSQGYTMFIDNLSSKNVIKMIVKHNLKHDDRPIVVAHQRGIPLVSFQAPKGGKTFRFKINKSDIPGDGIVHLTVFNGSGVPQCERLIYHDSHQRTALKILSDKRQYQPREKVELSMEVRDYKGNPLEGNFTISVTDKRQVNYQKDGRNIYNYLYLSSDVYAGLSDDVRGEIEQPNYYFDEANTNAPIDLDILLMSQGWRRFNWEDIIVQSQNKEEEIYSVEHNAISISGQAVQTNGKITSRPIEISLLYHPDSVSLEYLKAYTDTKGHFNFTGLDFYNQSEIKLQGVKANGGKSVFITVDKKKFPAYKAAPNQSDPFFFDRELLTKYHADMDYVADLDRKLRQSKIRLLDEVVITAKREEVYDERRSAYSKSAVTTVPITDLQCSGSISVMQMLEARVSGLEIRLNRSTNMYEPYIRNQKESPVILVDGILSDLESLGGILPCTVESIDVVKQPVPALGSMSGVISILTKRRNSTNDFSQEKAAGLIVMKMKGYDAPREFYSPTYEKIDMTKESVPDYRSTIYWNSHVVTDKDGKAHIAYWNPDGRTTVHILAEGLTNQGKPVYATLEYTIE